MSTALSTTVWEAVSEPTVAGVPIYVFVVSLAVVLLFRDTIVKSAWAATGGVLISVLRKVLNALAEQWSQFISKTEGNTTDHTPQKPRRDKSPAKSSTKTDRVAKITISDKVHKDTPTKRVGGSWVTGARISQAVANSLEVQWPTVGKLAKATHNQLKEFKEDADVSNSVQNLKALVAALRLHLA